MERGLKELSGYRFERALEEVDNARVALKNSRYRMALNRSYYAIFHGMRAVNILDGFDSSKHSGVIAHFNQYYVKTEVFSKDVSKIIHNASEMREQADYNDFFIAYRQDAEEQTAQAEHFLNLVQTVLMTYGVFKGC